MPINAAKHPSESAAGHHKSVLTRLKLQIHHSDTDDNTESKNSSSTG